MPSSSSSPRSDLLATTTRDRLLDAALTVVAHWLADRAKRPSEQTLETLATAAWQALRSQQDDHVP